MSTPATDRRHLVIVGATGMVGSYALRYALDLPSVERVTSISRRKTGKSHPKLDEVLHQNFSDCSELAQTLAGQRAAIFCLGTYTGTVTDAEMRKITVDYTAEFARVFHLSSPEASFSFLSGSGERKEPNFSYRLLRSVYPVFQLLFPNQVIRSDDLAKSMVDVAIRTGANTEQLVLENRDIREMVRQNV